MNVYFFGALSSDHTERVALIEGKTVCVDAASQVKVSDQLPFLG
jgi:hypothetical protein